MSTEIAEPIEFSQRLQEAMEEKNITSYRISKAIKISASTVGNYLKGKTSPDDMKLATLCDLLGINIEWLVNGEGEKYQTNESEKKYSRLSGDGEKTTVDRLLDLLEEQNESLKRKDDHIQTLLALLEKKN